MNYEEESYGESDGDSDGEFDANDTGYGHPAENCGEEGNQSPLVNVYLTGLLHDGIMALQFRTLKETEMFYIEYARQMGFGIRRQSLKRFSNNVPKRREWCCQKKARKKWIVTKFVGEHNHTLVRPERVNFVTAHRDLKDCDKAQIDSMRQAGLRTKDIRNVMVNQAGGHGNVGFQPKDLYNYIYYARGLHEADVDIQGVLGYFSGKKSSDPGFFYEHSVDEGNRMGNLFWSDCISRFDTMCFGDVIAFDSAFKRNRYDRPLVVVIGINHHHQSVILGCGILVNEEAQNYYWLLTQFLKCTGGQPIKSVVTDRHASMRKAIRETLPDATHRLCSWHLQRNAMAHVKDNKFVKAFSALMYKRVEEAQFETEWQWIVEEFDLENND